MSELVLHVQQCNATITALNETNEDLTRQVEEQRRQVEEQRRQVEDQRKRINNLEYEASVVSSYVKDYLTHQISVTTTANTTCTNANTTTTTTASSTTSTSDNTTPSSIPSTTRIANSPTHTLNKSASSQIHTCPRTLTQQFMSEAILTLLNPINTVNGGDNYNFHHVLSTTESLVFHTAILDRRLFSFNLHLSCEPVVSVVPVKPVVITFRSQTPVQLANTAPPSYITRCARATSSAAIPVPAVRGTITLKQHPFNTTSVLLKASLPVTPEQTLINSQTIPQISATATGRSQRRSFSSRSLSSRSVSSRSLMTRTTTTTNPNLAATLLVHLTQIIPRLYAQHARPLEIDEANLLHFESLLLSTTFPPIKPHETSIIDKSISYLDSPGPWLRIPNTVKSPVSYFQVSVVCAVCAEGWVAWRWTLGGGYLFTPSSPLFTHVGVNIGARLFSDRVCGAPLSTLPRWVGGLEVGGRRLFVYTCVGRPFVRTGSSFVHAAAPFVYTFVWQKISSVDSTIPSWGMAVADVDVAASRLCAWLWCFMSHERVDDHIQKNGILLRKEIDVPDSHSKIMCAIQKFPSKLDNRVFTIWWCWRRDPDGSFTLSFADAREFPLSDVQTKLQNALSSNEAVAECVEASTKGFWKVRSLAPNICRATLVQTANLGGLIPAFIGNTRVKSALKTTVRLQVRRARRRWRVAHTHV